MARRQRSSSMRSGNRSDSENADCWCKRPDCYELFDGLQNEPRRAAVHSDLRIDHFNVSSVLTSSTAISRE